MCGIFGCIRGCMRPIASFPGVREKGVLSLLQSSLGMRLWTQGLAVFPVQLHDTCNVGYVCPGNSAACVFCGDLPIMVGCRHSVPITTLHFRTILEDFYVWEICGLISSWWMSGCYTLGRGNFAPYHVINRTLQHTGKAYENSDFAITIVIIRWLRHVLMYWNSS